MIIVDQVRAHPWLAGGAIALAVLYFVMRNSAAGGGSEAVATGDPNADNLAIAQLQAQTQVAGINAGAQASANQNDASLHAMQLQQSSVDLANSLNAEVQLSGIGASADVAKQSNSLAASVAMANLTTQQNLAQIQSNTVVQTNAALVDVLNKQTAATTQIATQSWWDKTFG